MMVAKDSESSEKLAPTKVIRDKKFADRLDTAIGNHSRAPDGHGRQKWLRDELQSRLGEKLSAEAVRKWFAGEARPRPKIMSKIAQVLEVDEAWLALGITPTHTPGEKRRQNALAGGAVNVAAGLFQLAGANIAFPEGADRGFDFMAIVGGKSYVVQVKHAPKADEVRITVDSKTKEDALVLLVVGSGSELASYEFYRISDDVVNNHGRRKGGFIELDLRRDGTLHLGDDYLPIIKDFANLAGEVPNKKKSGSRAIQV